MGVATSRRDAEFVLAIGNGWNDSAEDDEQVEWVRDFWSTMQPISSGTYVNFIPAGEGREGVWAAYGEEKRRRLVEVKNEYDPNNLFRRNQNIKPDETLNR